MNTTTTRRLLTLTLAALGLIAVATGPASAGAIIGNHCQPTSLDKIDPLPETRGR